MIITVEDVADLLHLACRYPLAVRDEGLAVVARRHRWGSRAIALSMLLDAIGEESDSTAARPEIRLDVAAA